MPVRWWIVALVLPVAANAQLPPATGIQRLPVSLAPVESTGASAMETEPGAGAPRSSPASRRLLTREELWTAGAFIVGTALVVPFDQRLAREFEEPETHHNPGVARAASVFRTLGDPGTVVLTAGAYAVGRLTHRPGLADVGLHATEAVLVSGTTSAAIKLFVGRARPYTVVGQDADEFRVGRGTGGNTSFPSGHTTVAFAAAAAVSAEVARSDLARRHPAAVGAVAPLLYGGAALVGVSRMYHDAHWASDVVAAAGVGTLAGRAIVRLQHATPRGPGERRIERWLLPTTVAPVAGGIVIGWSGTFR